VLIGFFGHFPLSTKHEQEACAPLMRTVMTCLDAHARCSCCLPSNSGLFVAQGQAQSTKHEHEAGYL
jgi:hypothetical protein